jgi:protein-disulfide isomerase
MPAAGAKDADVTIVEFFDYNCPYCKETAPELVKLLHVDPKVRILYKEWPLFGDVSEYAARSALAANWQGKFLAAHDALIGTANDLDKISQVDAALKSAGVDLTQLARDRTAHATEITAILARNAREAAALGFRGTPGIVVGRQLLPRSLTVKELQQLTQDARSSP